MNGTENSDALAEEKPQHLKYLQEFRTTQCQLFLQHKCTQHRPFTCFNWHFANQRRRKPALQKDGTFNYNPDVYCPKYNENTGICPDGDDCQFVHRTAGDTERRYHPRYYKTATCVHETDAENHCVKNGPHCAFAHSAKDLRQPVYDAREKAEKAATGSTSGNGGPMLIDGILLAAGVGNGNNGLNTSISGKLVKSDRHGDKEDKDKEVIVDDLRWNDLQFVLINYKTELCRKPPRQCRQGYACPMYHNNKDRRRSPRKFKYRSTPCPNVKHGDEWGDPSHCELGDSCAYCHTRTEQQFHAEVYKSTKCNDVLQTGRCPRGPFCAFAHNDQELSMDRTAAIAAEELGTQPPPMSAGPYSAAVSVFGSTSQFEVGQTPPGGKVSPEGSTSGLSLRSSSMSETLASLESSYVAALQHQQLQQHRNSNGGTAQLPSFHRFSSTSSAVSPGLPIRHGSHNPDMAAAVHALSSSWNALSFLSSINQTADGSSVSSGLGGIPDDSSPPDIVQSLSMSQVPAGMSTLWGNGNSSARRAVAIAARQKLGRSMSLNAPMGPLSPRTLDFSGGNGGGGGIPLLVPSEEPDDFDLTSIDKELLSASSTGQQSTDRMGFSSSRMTHDSGDSTDSINGTSNNLNGTSAVWGTPPNSATAMTTTLGSTHSLSGGSVSGGGNGVSAVAAALGVSDNAVFLPNNNNNSINSGATNPPQVPVCQGLSLPEASSILQAYGALHDQQRQFRQIQHQRSENWSSTTGQATDLGLGLPGSGGSESTHVRMRSLSSCVYPTGPSFLSPRTSLGVGGDPKQQQQQDINTEDITALLRRTGLMDAASVEQQQIYEREINKLRNQNMRLLVQLKEIGGEAALAGAAIGTTNDIAVVASQLVEIRQSLLDNLSTVNALLLAHMTCSACQGPIGSEQLPSDAALMPKCAHALCSRCHVKLLSCPVCTAHGQTTNNSLNGRMNSRTAIELRAAATAAAAVALESVAKRRHMSAGSKEQMLQQQQQQGSGPLRSQHSHHAHQFHPYQLKQQQPVLSNNSAAENQSPTKGQAPTSPRGGDVSSGAGNDSARENANSAVSPKSTASD